MKRSKEVVGKLEIFFFGFMIAFFFSAYLFIPTIPLKRVYEVHELKNSTGDTAILQVKFSFNETVRLFIVSNNSVSLFNQTCETDVCNTDVNIANITLYVLREVK
ncbi:MAG: hypothetical protein AABY22_12820 [Nanoarchaeota archaeon]